MRRLNSDITLRPEDMILPIFLDENIPLKGAQSRPVTTMPGVSVHNEESALLLTEKALQKKIPSVILFGVPDKKDENGSGGDKENAIVPQFATRLKKKFGSEIVVMADLCMCEYTSHGHCGILTASGDVDNDLTLKRLADYTRVYAYSGIDNIAPSGMMDGMISAIRRTLEENNFRNTSILSYAVKYASAFYGPFRDAAQSTPSFGDRKNYQMSFNRQKEALLEAELDIAEGADMIMVKPALPYLDVIQSLKENFYLPVYAYQVSGEYAMVKIGGEQNLFNADEVMYESLIAIKRAGATAIISYAALDVEFYR
jgi:porphobilinogen synthase